jgi:transposase
MDKTGDNQFLFEGPTGSLTIKPGDEVARKLAMLIEGKCMGLGPTKAAQKYDYTKQRFFQLFKDYQKGGSAALVSKKKGPKNNYVRTESNVSQVIRHQFLDPVANADVITQKMKQVGIKISKRSVERIIAEHGIQKKTFTSSVPKTRNKRLKSNIPKSGKNG